MTVDRSVIKWESIPHHSVQLTMEEKRKFAQYCLMQAYSAWSIALQLQHINLLAEVEFNKAMRWLETACDVWPLDGDGDSINIEQILQGRQP